MTMTMEYVSACTRRLAVAATVLMLASCSSLPSSPQTATMFSTIRSSEHRGADDLLTAGLGIDGLRNATAPPFADATAPTPEELRRRALWNHWRGIADLSPGGRYGELYGSVARVPGREFSALARLPGAQQVHRVLLQVPDEFDRQRRCVVVAASSGSRGIHGAIAVAGAWGLPKGCAVAYTDKGAGSDYFDLDTQVAPGLDGAPGNWEEGLAFAPDAPATAAGSGGVAIKHAHSRDNPEADWGRHVRHAAEFALQALNQALPAQAPFDFGNTRIIAVGLSNGGGAVLRAAEDADDWLDAVVAAEPNVHVDGARPLYDYSTEAAVLMPCALLALDDVPGTPMTAMARRAGELRCASLVQAGLLTGADVPTQARVALMQMRGRGWTDGALRAGAASVDFDLWRVIVATYASAYGRYGVDEHPCGYRYAALQADGTPRAATGAERAGWWSDASGIPPGAGVALLDTRMQAPDFALAALQCLRDLWTGDSEAAQRVRSGIAQTRASLPRAGLPVVVVHGLDDGLVPAAFSSAPYVAMAQAAGRDVRYWQVRNAQHFDAFLAFPDYGARYVPLLPYVYAALDGVMAHLDGMADALPTDAVIDTRGRGDEVLDASHLRVPSAR